MRGAESGFEFAARQLATAVELFFDDGDLVSVCTLAHVASKRLAKSRRGEVSVVARAPIDLLLERTGHNERTVLATPRFVGSGRGERDREWGPVGEDEAVARLLVPSVYLLELGGDACPEAQAFIAWHLLFAIDEASEAYRYFVGFEPIAGIFEIAQELRTLYPSRDQQRICGQFLLRAVRSKRAG